MAQQCRHLRLDSKNGGVNVLVLFVGYMLLCVTNWIVFSDASTFKNAKKNWSWEDPLARSKTTARAKKEEMQVELEGRGIVEDATRMLTLRKI